jgi:hypothetical protein
VVHVTAAIHLVTAVIRHVVTFARPSTVTIAIAAIGGRHVCTVALHGLEFST